MVVGSRVGSPTEVNVSSGCTLIVVHQLQCGPQNPAGAHVEDRALISVRAATPADAAAVGNVHVRSWQVAYRGLLPDEYLDGLRPEDRMTRYAFGSSDPGLPHTYVATMDNAICGFVTSGPCEDEDAPAAGEILALYVDPENWGLGAGRLLMQEARGRLCDQGFTEAVLWVLVGNRRAERFYGCDGWVLDDRRREVQVWGVDVDESRYRRRLP